MILVGNGGGGGGGGVGGSGHVVVALGPGTAGALRLHFVQRRWPVWEADALVGLGIVPCYPQLSAPIALERDPTHQTALPQLLRRHALQ